MEFSGASLRQTELSYNQPTHKVFNVQVYVLFFLFHGYGQFYSHETISVVSLYLIFYSAKSLAYAFGLCCGLWVWSFSFHEG